MRLVKVTAPSDANSFPIVAVLSVCLLLSGCHSGQSGGAGPSIEFDTVPAAGEGGPVPIVPIAGHAKGAHTEDKIVVYAKAGNGIWWIQPVAMQPFTPIAQDSSWTASTHLGTEYAALLVRPGYRPAPTTDALPGKSDKVLAVAVIKGTGPYHPAEARTVEFSGYEWRAMGVTSERNGVPNIYDPDNVSVDSNGRLHLRIVRKSDHWTCSEAILPHSFGYGTYLFTVEDVSHVESAAVLTLFTWDDLGAEQNHREMDVEISRWGDPATKNAQFVLQPYYVPENVVRFSVPSGRMTYSFVWDPAKVSFRATQGTNGGSQGNGLASHTFTSGIPTPGSESVSMNFCAFGFSKVPLKNDAEVIVDRFQYLP